MLLKMLILARPTTSTFTATTTIFIITIFPDIRQHRKCDVTNLSLKGPKHRRHHYDFFLTLYRRRCFAGNNAWRQH